MREIVSPIRMLCFAHRQEAHAFLKNENWTPLSDYQDVWAREDELLVMTGEGQEQALSKVSFLLGRYPSLKDIINFGVVGALRPEFEKGQVIEIGTVYHEESFHSFELTGPVDLISASKRVLDPLKAEKLSHFAPVVDRELWAIAYACKEAKVYLRSLKIISDEPHQSSESYEVCERVRDEAPILSQALYQKILSMRSSVETPKEQTVDPMNLLDNKLFHFSMTQKRQYLKMCVELDEKQKDDFSQQMGPVYELSRPKDRAREVLKILQRLHTPIEAYVRDELEVIKSKAQQLGVTLHFDPKLEELEARVTVSLKPESKVGELQALIDQLNLKRAFDLLQGKFDV